MSNENQIVMPPSIEYTLPVAKAASSDARKTTIGAISSGFARRPIGCRATNIRRASTDLGWLLTRRYGFGTDEPDRALVSFVERMNSQTDTEVVARYLRTVYTHARYPALEALKRTKVLVICGEDDKITPPEHSAEICRILPDASFVAVPGAGHVALLERPDVVNPALLEFLEQIV